MLVKLTPAVFDDQYVCVEFLFVNVRSPVLSTVALYANVPDVLVFHRGTLSESRNRTRFPVHNISSLKQELFDHIIWVFTIDSPALSWVMLRPRIWFQMLILNPIERYKVSITDKLDYVSNFLGPATFV